MVPKFKTYNNFNGESLTKDIIITHPGSAHFDEFFAISLILSVHDDKTFEIFRREPLEDELRNPDIWVVDIGGQHNEKLKNFDHHQDLDTKSSFVIVADHLKLSSKMEIFDWWVYKDKIDRFGPIKVGKEMHINNLMQTYSPFEEWYLEYFARNPNDCIDLMKAFGKCILKEADELYEGILFWKNSDVHLIKNKTVRVGLTDDTKGALEYCNSLAKPFEITVSFDKRGEGWTLKRYNDNPSVNFYRIAGHKDIKFAHIGGFIAKTKKRIPIEDVLNLVELSID